MFKFITMYRRVDDEAALEKFFSKTHLPLAEQLPGLIKSEVCRVTGQPTGKSRFHMTYTLCFKTESDYRRALISEPGLQLIRAITPWANARLITWFYGEAYEDEARQDEEE